MARRSNDLLVLPVLLVCLIARRWARLPHSTVLMGASAITGALVLFCFNPIQSARPIFSRHDTPAIRAIEAEVKPDGTLAMEGLPGAVLNGLGYASVAHVTAVPALAYWRTRYPDLPEAEFQSVFNRYSHIRPSDVERPMSPQADVVEVSLKDFWPDRIDLPSTRSDLMPIWLAPGQRVTGQLGVERPGTFAAVQVFIGTGAGSADGILNLRVCDAMSRACATGRRDLREAVDNAYVTLPLDRPLTLSSAPGVMDYDLWTDEAHRPVALLTQRIQGTTTPSLKLDGTPTGTAVRLRIDLQREAR